MIHARNLKITKRGRFLSCRPCIRLRVVSVEKLKGDLHVFPIVFDAPHMQHRACSLRLRLFQGFPTCRSGFFKACLRLLRLLFKAQPQGLKAKISRL